MKIVVGVDGSPAARAALEFACKEAELHGGDVVVVHAWEFPYVEIGAASAADAFDLIEPAAQAVLDEAAAIASKYCGDRATVSKRLVHGGPAASLIDAGKDADLIVVGSRGRGGFASLLLGSTSQQVVHHAAVPVAIVREPKD